MKNRGEKHPWRREEAVEEHVEEHWFHQYYRVTVAESGDEYVVSVDVYRHGWDWDACSKICVEEKNTCILYNTVSPEELAEHLGGDASLVKHAERIGLSVGERVETISVRLILAERPTRGLIEKIFYAAWRLIGCSPPRENMAGGENQSLLNN